MGPTLTGILLQRKAGLKLAFIATGVVLLAASLTIVLLRFLLMRRDRKEGQLLMACRSFSEDGLLPAAPTAAGTGVATTAATAAAAAAATASSNGGYNSSSKDPEVGGAVAADTAAAADTFRDDVGHRS